MPEGRNYIFPRLLRHAYLMAVEPLENDAVNRIFSTISEWHFSKGYTDKVAHLAKVFKSYV